MDSAACVKVVPIRSEMMGINLMSPAAAVYNGRHEPLIGMVPTVYSSAQLRALQRPVKVWRADRARELVTRILEEPEGMGAGAA